MPVTRADELDASAADNAKELLALAEKALREIYDMTTDRRLVNRLAEIEKCAEETLNKIAVLRLVRFPECETPEPTLRQMVHTYYRMGLNPDLDKAKEYADRYIATTPQPAAGWDDLLRKIEYATRKDSLTDHERIQSIRSLVCAEISKSETLRREAPAPAKYWESMYTDLLKRVSAGEFARPDTAEARLREALEQIKSSIDTRLNSALCEMRPDYDDSIVGFNEAWDIVRKFLHKKIESLSPPSGGDEAKESEGGRLRDPEPLMAAVQKAVAAFNALSPEQQETHLRAQRESYVRAEMELSRIERGETQVSPSEPPPPADRREIVAQVPAEKMIEWASDFEAAAHEVPRGIKATVLMTRAQEVCAILAVLDGGRDA